MNRRNFFTWIAAAIGWLGTKRTGNCFVAYKGHVDLQKPAGRFTSFEAAKKAGADAIAECPPEAWFTNDISSLTIICLSMFKGSSIGCEAITVKSLRLK